MTADIREQGSTGWRLAYELDERREPRRGSVDELRQAIRGGADLRIGTAFRHNEHIDTTSDDDELIREHMDFRVTYWIDERWVAAIETLRMPVELPDGFGQRPSQSLFLYNEDGSQAVARPYLDGLSPSGAPAASTPRNDPRMPRMRVLEAYDEGTNAPSHRFVYDFDYYRFFVAERWREAYSHDADGSSTGGSLDDLVSAVDRGSEVKIAVSGLCDDLAAASNPVTRHEVFIHVGPCYYYARRKHLVAAANPLVRVAPRVPLTYRSAGWDFGWILARTDGHVARWLCDPYSLKFTRSSTRHAIRWFVDRS